MYQTRLHVYGTHDLTFAVELIGVSTCLYKLSYVHMHAVFISELMYIEQHIEV